MKRGEKRGGNEVKRRGRPPKEVPKLAETPEEIARAIFAAADRKKAGS